MEVVRRSIDSGEGGSLQDGLRLCQTEHVRLKLELTNEVEQAVLIHVLLLASPAGCQRRQHPGGTPRAPQENRGRVEKCRIELEYALVVAPAEYRDIDGRILAAYDRVIRVVRLDVDDVAAQGERLVEG